MNKALFQSMFSSLSGNIYSFSGKISKTADPTAVITEKFVTAAGSNLMSIVVVETRGIFVVYTDLLDLVTSIDFTFLTDLTPDVIVEPVEEITEEVDSTITSDQE